jgi:hypothetical protein
LPVQEEARTKNICSTEELFENIVERLIAYQRKALLKEYSFVKSFVKLGVVVVIPLLTYLTDETAQRSRIYSTHYIKFGRESEVNTRSV